MTDKKQITAAMLIIGNEVLSGRTQDKNLAFVGNALGEIGIDMKEVRIVPDEQDEIVDAVNALLREKFTYVFTSGGIGPTHDDITADCIAAAFGVSLDMHPLATQLLEAHYEAQGIEFNAARARMARIPDGASLIDNPVSTAPGFRIGNVHVMAGAENHASDDGKYFADFGRRRKTVFRHHYRASAGRLDCRSDGKAARRASACQYRPVSVLRRRWRGRQRGGARPRYGSAGRS